MRPFKNKIDTNKSTSIKNIDGFLSWEDIAQILLTLKQENLDIVVIWAGELGDKAKSFREKTQAIHQVGLSTTKKILLWSDIVEQCIDDKRILTAVSQAVSTYYDYAPVLITRSSGQWDAQGVGIYESYLTVNNPISILKAFHKVTDSNDTPRAIDYREKLWIVQKGMWVFIEPCIGNIHYDKYIWPELSGRWKTNESWILELWVSGGIGWGVRDRNYYNILLNTYFQTTLKDYIQNDINNFRSKNFANISLFRQFEKKYGLEIPMYNIEDKCIADMALSKEIKEEIYKYPIAKLKKSIQQLEKINKVPQYFERAAVHNGKWEFTTYITQLADALYTTLTIDRKQKGKCLADIRNVIGSWTKEFTKILYVNVSHDLSYDYHGEKKDLATYNKQNKDYLLIISDTVTYGDQDLDFEEFSNAGAIIEIVGRLTHSGEPSSHYRWLMSTVNILFGIMDEDKSSVFKDLPSQRFDGNCFLKEITDTTIILTQDARAWVGKLFLK